jgi:branched-chain amino acid transport system ATP-binding protein
MSYLIVENLTVAYGDIQAVKGISFEVRQGEIFTLIGANGSGKTSTLQAISNLLPHSGQVLFEGRDLRGIAADQLVSMGIAHVPEGRGIFGNLTVLENLKIGAWTRHNPKATAADLDRLLTTLPRLRERLTQTAGTLSGGEQQMLAVARALLSRPRILLLDEPSMGLAPKLVKEIYALLAEINQTGVTLLLVEQNANISLKFAQRAAVLETGMIILNGPSPDLLANPKVRAAYLGA